MVKMLAGSWLCQFAPRPTPGLKPCIRRLAFWLFTLGLGLIAWFGLLSHFPSIAYRPLHGHGDLLQHVCAFAYIGFLSPVLWRPASTVAGILVASAGLLEIAQIASPLHQASLLDWAASSSGVGLGAALFVLARHTVTLVSWRTAETGPAADAENAVRALLLRSPENERRAGR